MVIVMNIKVVVGKDIRKERHRLSVVMELNGEKIRAIVLVRDNYLCQECLKQGLFVTATTVDHITPKAHGGSDDLTNLQSLCNSCHKFKTARERLK